MARRNYDQMYNSEVVKEEKKVEPVADTVREKVEEKKPKAKKSYSGTVIGGRRLNVRNAPNGEIVGSLADGEKIKIVDDTNKDWYKIDAPEGFVKKEFVQV